VRRFALALLLLPAAQARAQEAPPSYEAASDVRVHFEAEAPDGDERRPGLVLSRAVAGGGFTSLCLAPCDLSLPRGPTAFAIGSGNRGPVPVPLAIDLTDDARLVGHYESRQWLRELGVGFLLGSAALALVGIAIGVTGFLANDVTVGAGGLVAAGSVAVVGGATGIALATLDDLATIDLL